MLATIILDSFTKENVSEIADALKMICCPSDTYGFASACIYAFWSIPERDLLYVGLATDVTTRFCQHTGLRQCDPASCKRHEIDEYFKAHSHLGYSIMAQSCLDQPLTRKDQKGLTQLYDEAFAADVANFLTGEQNVKLAEGLLLQLYHRLDGKLPKWNRIQGSKRAWNHLSLGGFQEPFLVMNEMLRTGRQADEIMAELTAKGPPYDLLFNLIGYELSELNARSTLREIARDATIEGQEELLHSARVQRVAFGIPIEKALKLISQYDSIAQQRIEAMAATGYLERQLMIPGLN